MGLTREMIVTVLSLLAVILLTEACNEDICGPQVSKCMLIKCCECDMSDKKNCACCQDCQVCLSKFYTECCDCVGLCAKQDPHDTPRKTSSVEDLFDPIPDLFNVLTEQDDHLMRWTSKSYPALSEVLFKKPNVDNMDSSFDVSKSLEKAIEEELLSKQNCTVAFMSQCMSIRKCKLSCKSMGAAKYRWFHANACCECISSTCYDYGLNQPQCLDCPLDDDELLELELAGGVKNEGAGQMLSAVEKMIDKV